MDISKVKLSSAAGASGPGGIASLQEKADWSARLTRRSWRTGLLACCRLAARGDPKRQPTVSCSWPQRTGSPCLGPLSLTRGQRRVRFVDAHTLVVLRGDLNHGNLWRFDLQTGAMQQLTNLPAEFAVRDFDVSPDGREAVLERVQDRSDVVLIDRPDSR